VFDPANDSPNRRHVSVRVTAVPCGCSLQTNAELVAADVHLAREDRAHILLRKGAEQAPRHRQGCVVDRVGSELGIISVLGTIIVTRANGGIGNAATLNLPGHCVSANTQIARWTCSPSPRSRQGP
jgi:hypothetical protein